MSDAEGDAPERLLKRLAVCRGGFTYEAARGIGLLTPPPDPLLPQGLPSVAEFREGEKLALSPPPPDSGEAGRGLDAFHAALAALQTWQFVAFDTAAQRYSIDPLVIAAGEDDSAHRPHYDFYKALAWKHDEAQDYAGLDVESANLEAAFEWALASGDGEDALRLANACGFFLMDRSKQPLRMFWRSPPLAPSPSQWGGGVAQSAAGVGIIEWVAT